MQTLELGYVNAGFVLFALLILSTLVFGRFFCGWGCHVVALQDLCGWMLRKMGIRPKPFRSRLLVFVPLLAAFYMFAWPSIARAISGEKAPRWVAHFMTDDFWATFPTFGIAVLTFVVCGFLIVVLLGNKGFCTYGCPYGGIFYYADAVAPGKIRVTDSCDGCGHCTATCTSNVRVHEEVRDYGMVVDSGCMKCMDCVDVCPKKALYWGFGKPGISKRRVSKQPRKYDLSWGEEVFVGVSFLIALYALRGLFDAVPFLLALGLSAICAYLFLIAFRVVSRDNARLQRWQLKVNRKVSGGGIAYLLFATCLIMFLAYASYVMYNVREGEAAYEAMLKDSTADHSIALNHYQKAVGVSPFLVEKWESRVGALLLFDGDSERAAKHLRRAVSVRSDDSELRFMYGRALVSSGESKRGIEQLSIALSQTEPSDQKYAQRLLGLTSALIREGRIDEAEDLLLRLDPIAIAQGTRLAATVQLIEAKKFESAFLFADSARVAAPMDSQVLALWAQAAAMSGKLESLIKENIRASADDIETWYATAFLYMARGDTETANQIYDRIRRLAPTLVAPQ
jgi:tetratricopeptide (TPR) repeat protein/ferredoxin